MNDSRTVGADGREEVLCLETVDNFVEFLSITGEEDGTGPRAISDADDVALDEWRAVWGRAERLVVAARTGRMVSGRILVKA